MIESALTGVLAFCVGYLLGNWSGRRDEGELAAANKAAILERVGWLEADRSQRSELVRELMSQIIRLQRANVGLPELTPPELKPPEDVEDPPIQLVRMCALFPNEGSKMMKAAISERRKGIPWEFIISSLRNQIEARGGGPLLEVLDKGG